MAQTHDISDQVRQILLKDWDPSNASRIDAAKHEYDRYIPPLVELIRSHAGEEAIVSFLKERESEIMCFPALGSDHLKRTAKKLAQLRSNE